MAKLKTNFNKSKLEGGKVYQNYKELCEDLEIKYTTGSSKIAQFKDLACVCEYEQEGHKIKIIEVFHEEKDREKRKGNNNRTKESNLIVNAYPELAKLVTNPIGVSVGSDKKLIEFTCIKCEDVSFKSPRSMVTSKGKCTVCSMSKYSKRVYKLIKHLNIKLEYTFDDLKSKKGYPLRFDFALLDDSDELIGLIEYDGK